MSNLKSNTSAAGKRTKSRQRKKPSMLQDFDVEDWPLWDESTTEDTSVTVEYKEDGRLKCVSEAKSWKLQKMDEDASSDGDTELQFADLRKGDAVMAYWSPNRAYYPATVVKTSKEGNSTRETVKRQLSLDLDKKELEEMGKSTKYQKKSEKSAKLAAVSARNNSLLQLEPAVDMKIQSYHSSATSTTSVSSKQTTAPWNGSRQDTEKVTRARDSQREASTSDILLESDEPSSTNITLVAIFGAIKTLQEILIPMSERLETVENLLSASSNQSFQSPAMGSSPHVPCTHPKKPASSSQALLSPPLVVKAEEQRDETTTVCLGDPSLEIRVNRKALVRASVKAGRRNQLALNLLDILFEPTTLAESTVNGTRDGSKKALDSAKIDAIKSHCLEKFPLRNDETLKEVMQKLTKSITDKCTSLGKDMH